MDTDSDEADVALLGRLFHTFAPATVKADLQLLTDDRLERQVFQKMLHWCSMSVTHVNDDAK